MLGYSLHVGSGKHSIITDRDLKKASNHNSRKFENQKNPDQIKELEKHNIVLRGSNNPYGDIKKFYKEYFSESLQKYNDKQKRSDRKIYDYYEKVESDKSKNIAVEVIIQLGDKSFWKNKDIENKKKMTQVFEDQLQQLEKTLKDFHICNATIHFDETSPHIQILGVPVSENNKKGLEKQVSKNKVFTQKTLLKLQAEMREHCIKEFNRVYQTNEILKPKEDGREYQEIEDYKKHQDQLILEAEKEQIQELEKKKDKILEVEHMILEKKPSIVGGYKFTAEELNHVLDNVREAKQQIVVSNQLVVELQETKKELEIQKKQNYEHSVTNRKLLDELNQANRKLKIQEKFILKCKELFPDIYQKVKTAIVKVKELSSWGERTKDKDRGITR